jgi:taurine--2-oxoglutarate transaminase
LREEGFLAEVSEKGDYLGQQLRELAPRHRSVGDVRGIGLFWTIELVKDPATGEPLRRATEKYTPTIVQQISRFLLEEKNIYVPSDKFGVWVVPPLIVTRDEIDFLVSAIDESLALADAEV